MKKKCAAIIEASRKQGWVLEPEAKEIFNLFGLKTTHYQWIKKIDDIKGIEKKFTFPVIAKVVSPDIMHKTDSGGVIMNISDEEEVAAAFRKLSGFKGFAGILIDEYVRGTELIMGAKDDHQFGKIVMIGIGGTSVEIYRDVAIRLAPVDEIESLNAIRSLRGIKLLEGHRGSEPVNISLVAGIFSRFSKMVYDLGDDITSIEANPLICSGEKALIADARIILT